MTSQQMRAMREAIPFRTFTMHMTDGRSFRIPHRDYLSMTPGGRTAIVYHGGESFSIVNVRLVTELSVDDISIQTAEG